jgi:MYXO-CTERM domain-containing protein
VSRSPRSRLSITLGATLWVTATLATPALAQDFSYLPPGDLVTDSGEGLADDTVFAPGMRFPIENAPAYANTQVYYPGGMYGPSGGQCDAFNYSYPWRDNYCEIRSWDMPLCPAGTGHQGQDIRPATCDNSTHPAVATVDGTITNIGTYSVYLTAADGTRYDYLHMSNVQVTHGQDVVRGQQLGMVSNEFGGTPTTIHLHFNIRQNVDGLGSVYVPPYMSLVTSYAALIDTPPTGSLDEVGCSAIEGWAFDADEPETALDVILSFATQGASDDHVVTADHYRADLCEALDHCDHGFSVLAPLSLFDDTDHEVRAAADYDTLGTEIELPGSPMTLQCAPIELSGARRPVPMATFEQWSFSAFWDEAPAPSEDVEALPLSEAWPSEPTVVMVEGDAEAWWLVDDGERRVISGPEVARAWRLDVAAAEALPQSEIDALPAGPPLRPRPVLLRDSEDELFMLDDLVQTGSSSSGVGGSNPAIPGGNAGCGCRVGGRDDSHASGGLLLALIGALASRRRRSATGQGEGRL